MICFAHYRQDLQDIADPVPVASLTVHLPVVYGHSWPGETRLA